MRCLSSCDPVAQNCPEGEACYPSHGTFECAPAPDVGLTGSGAGCEFINSCDAGLICLNPGLRSDCPPGAGGCCIDVCNVAAPDCPAGLECIAFYEPFPHFPTNLPRHLENVGVCVDPI